MITKSDLSVDQHLFAESFVHDKTCRAWNEQFGPHYDYKCRCLAPDPTRVPLDQVIALLTLMREEGPGSNHEMAIAGYDQFRQRGDQAAAPGVRGPHEGDGEMKHDFGNGPMVHDTHPQQAWCYRCYLLVNYGQGEQPCTGNPYDEVARLSALVQGMETWLTDLIEDDATYQEYRELYEDVLAELTRLKAQQ